MGDLAFFVRSRGARRLLVVVVAALALVASCVPEPEVDSNFQVQTVFGGLVLPTAVRFAPDGTVFVAERAGPIFAYPSVNDGQGVLVADLKPRVTTMWDRGLAGLEVDPGFSTGRPYIYALYSLDARIGEAPPAYPDDCLFDGVGNNGVCGVTSGELVRIEVGPDLKAVSQTVLINDWCQQFGGHSVSDLEFAPDGSLFVSAGEGASFEIVDHGQLGGNPCGDPVNEGGMLRSQDVRTTGDPTGLGGTVIRIDPDTGDAWPTNPWYGDPDPNRAKVVAYGFREPFRMNYDVVTDKLYVGDVGWGLFEELNVIDPSQPPGNYGWPCFEGNDRQPGVDAENIPLCESLTEADVIAPEFAYSHLESLDPASCGGGGSSITGTAIVHGNNYPAPYNDGLYFSDYSNQCIFYVPRAADGTYDLSARKKIVSKSGAVDLQVGPGGDLYFAEIFGNAIRRISATGTNHSPEARMTVTPAFGPVPLDVTLDGSASTDADTGQNDTLTYEWELDGDGLFDDASGAVVNHTFTTAGNINVSLRVTDLIGASSVVSSIVHVGNEPPVPVIDLPVEGTVAPGTQVDFAGHATDAQDGTIPASGLDWRLVIQHCDSPTSCHEHEITTIPGSAGSHFEMPAHPNPSYLDVELTATDSDGAKANTTVRLTIGE